MKVNAYTIEWTEPSHPILDMPNFTVKSKRIAAFDNYPQARAKAITLLRGRCEYASKFQETHEVDHSGMVYNRLRAKQGRHWYQVTIKYHPSANVTPVPLW